MLANRPPTATIITLGRIIDMKNTKITKDRDQISPGCRFCDLMFLSTLRRLHNEESLIEFSQVRLITETLFGALIAHLRYML